jgi:long-chain acyl-CoA synthetase
VRARAHGDAGLLAQPELTAEALRGGWMHTGDAGYLDDEGFLFLVDRVKDMIISGGENVYSAAVENVIYQFPGVHECAVIGVPSEQWGEAVHAIVVPRPVRTSTSIRCSPTAAPSSPATNARRPSTIATEELPKSGAGKILKTDLRAPFWQGQARSIH